MHRGDPARCLRLFVANAFVNFLTMHWHITRRFDSDAGLIAVDREQRDFDIVSDGDGLAQLSGQYEHFDSLFLADSMRHRLATRRSRSPLIDAARRLARQAPPSSLDESSSVDINLSLDEIDKKPCHKQTVVAYNAQFRGRYSDPVNSRHQSAPDRCREAGTIGIGGRLSMFNIIPLSFRFRGKQNRLLDLYAAFQDADAPAMHPTQLARATGISLAEVSRRLDATPELFVKLPRRPDGITRYRLTSATAARSEEEVVALIHSGARRENWLVYALGTMMLLMFVVIVVMIGPAL